MIIAWAVFAVADLAWPPLLFVGTAAPWPLRRRLPLLAGGVVVLAVAFVLLVAAVWS